MNRILFFCIAAGTASTLIAGCEKAPQTTQDVHKQVQKQEEDKKALGGQFKKSEGKAY